MQEARKIDPENLELALMLARSYLQNGFNEEEIRFKLRKKFDEYEVSQALETLRESNENQGETSALRDRNDYYGWYEKPKEDAGYHWPGLKDQLLHKENPWTSEMIEGLDRASTTVVSNLAPPMSQKSIKVKGLVLGYIQSGKTANFSATIAKAVDEGYRLVIVLAGMHNNLRKQTELRLRSELVNPNESKTCTTLTDVDEKGDFKRRQPVTANSQLSRSDGFVLVVLKKNSTVLRNFNRWLDGASNDVLKVCPALIIDDESDQASINTNKEDKDPTKINSHIRNLISRFHVVSYVGYTATPFANVFIDSNVEDDIYPSDFLVTLEKPKTYYGPEELFGRNSVNGRDSSDGMPVIRTIPEEEADLLRDNARGKVNLEDLPESLKRAFMHFLAGSLIRLSRGQWKEHMTMLIHVSHLTDSHSTLYKKLGDYIEELRDRFEDDDEEVVEHLKSIWESDFVETTEKILGSVDHNFEKMKKNALRFLESLELIMDNSNSNERLTFDRDIREGSPLWGVIVGGNTLSRGLTLEGLTTSYFVRASKAYDTLLQMGRWFGYRKGFVDATRIFVPDDLYYNFYELATIEQEIRDEINLMSSNRERPVDVALRIRKIPNMLITAANKSRNAHATDMSYSGTKVQTHQIVTNDVSIIRQTESAISSLLTTARSEGKRVPVNFKELEASYLYRNVSKEAVQHFLDRVYVSANNSKFIRPMIQDYISDTASLTDWSVGLISLKTGDTIRIAGHDVSPVQRNAKHESVNEKGIMEATLRAVSTPGHELIDLEDQLQGKFRTLEDLLEPKGEPKRSDIQLRHSFRPKDRGLILIYPLKFLSGVSEEEFKAMKSETQTSFPLRGNGQLFGISIIFPFTNRDAVSKVYFKNRSV